MKKLCLKYIACNVVNNFSAANLADLENSELLKHLEVGTRDKIRNLKNKKDGSPKLHKRSISSNDTYKMNPIQVLSSKDGENRDENTINGITNSPIKESQQTTISNIGLVKPNLAVLNQPKNPVLEQNQSAESLLSAIFGGPKKPPNQGDQASSQLGTGELKQSELQQIKSLLQSSEFNNERQLARKFTQNIFIWNQEQLNKEYKRLINHLLDDENTQDFFAVKKTFADLFLGISKRITNLEDASSNLTNDIHKQKKINLDNLKFAVEKTFTPVNISRYQIYDSFIKRLYESGYIKFQYNNDTALSLSKEDLLSDFDHYSIKLALAMTKKGITQVRYQSKGKLFRDVSEWDVFFKHEKGGINKYILDALPIKANNGIYTFTHKSIQEFFVAKYIYQELIRFPTLMRLDIVRVSVKLLKQYIEIDLKNDKLESANPDFLLQQKIASEIAQEAIDMEKQSINTIKGDNRSFHHQNTMNPTGQNEINGEKEDRL